VQIFEYVAVLTSIVIGLGITHLLQGVARIIQHPGRERLYSVHLTWVAYMFVNAVFWWWWEFRLSELDAWTFQIYLFVILYAVNIYLLCALLFPADLAGYDGYKDYFYSRRRWFFGLAAFSFAIDYLDSWVKGPEHLANLGLEYLIAAPLQTVLLVAAAFTREERFHRVLAIAALAYQMSAALRYFETMG